MFSKLRNITSFTKEDKDLIDLTALKGELCEGLFNIMETAFEQRHSDLQNSKLTPADIDNLVKEYSNKNMLLAAATSIVPGPFGILSSIPELVLNFKNQMDMIYDLGCAHGKENFINKDVLLDIPFAAFGGNTNLAVLQNNVSDLSDSPQDALMTKAGGLAEALIQKTLKKSIVQFIPVAGPILMGTWAKMTTNKIYNSSTTFLDNSVIYVEHLKPTENPSIQKELLIEKIKALANLIEANNEINENQIDLIKVIIDNADLTEQEKEYYLTESLRTGSNFKLNYSLLTEYEEAESLIMELVIMAKRSGRIDDLEKAYILAVTKELKIDPQFTEELF